METLFKTNKLCGNCFWFLPDDHKCHFWKHEPDMCEKSCIFFESKANARKIIQASLVLMDDEDGIMPRYVDPEKKESHYHPVKWDVGQGSKNVEK